MRRAAFAAALGALAVGLAGCGSSGPVPGDAAQTYLSDLAEGNYPAACGMLSGEARSALVRATGGHLTCQAIYRHCLPSNPAALKRDQTQLLYGAEESFAHGRHARVLVSGTEVARLIKRVTLVRHGYRWFLVYPGNALRDCRPATGVHARHRQR